MYEVIVTTGEDDANFIVYNLNNDIVSIVSCLCEATKFIDCVLSSSYCLELSKKLFPDKKFILVSIPPIICGEKPSNVIREGDIDDSYLHTVVSKHSFII